MKLLFISANRLRRIMPPVPLGLASVIGQVDDSRHEISVLDLMFSVDPVADLKRTLAEYSPDLTAISVRNLDNQCSIKTEYLLPEVKDLLAHCRENSDAPIVIGGPAVTVTPAAVFDYLEPDFAIAGEGELAFPELLRRIETGGDYSSVPGLTWRTADGVRVNPTAHVPELDALRPPRRELFDNQRYLAEGGIGNILIKQGCPFRCLYCDSPHTLGPRWRKRAPELVADELESIERHSGVSIVFFTDALFNHPVAYAEQVCRAIVNRKLGLKWVAGVHPAFLTRDLLELMHEAGCRMISLGCDTASAKMLEVMRKDFTKEHLNAALDMLEDMDMKYLLSLLVGGPGENRETVEESVAFLADRKPAMLNLCIGIRLMPHTPLTEIAIREGVIAADDPLMEPRFYVSSGVEGWVEDYLTEVCADRPGWTVT